MLRRLIAAAVLVCCLSPATAAAGYMDVIRDCTDNGQMDKKYSQKEYRDALSRMPTDAAQYNGCNDIIKRAQVSASRSRDDSQPAAGGGGDAGGNDAGGAGQVGAPTPDEHVRAQQDVNAARRSGAGDQRLANVDVRPGALAYRDFGAVSKLPTPLAVLGVLLLAAAIAVCAYLLRGRVRARNVSV